MCKFFTDGLQLTKELQKNLSAEQKIHRDIEFMPFEETRIFGIRFLYQIMWAKAKYEFKFMLHMDDDYFLCLEKLKSELYHRPKKSLVWGSYHCSFKDIIYVDEAWIIFSSDVIEQFLSQDPQTILCHPHSDQQIAVWLSTLYGSKKSLIEFHDGRLHHYPPARKLDKFKNLPQVCDNFLGVHGSSPEMIKKFGRNSADRRRILKLPKLTRITETCHFPNVFNISKVAGMYQFDLRPCITNPRWTPGEGMWRGTQWDQQQKKISIKKRNCIDLNAEWLRLVSHNQNRPSKTDSFNNKLEEETQMWCIPLTSRSARLGRGVNHVLCS